MPGPDLPQRLRPQPAGRRAGGDLLTRHLGNPIPRRRCSGRSASVSAGRGRVAKANAIPVVRLGKDERKIEMMRPCLEAATARGGRDRLAQEFQCVFTG